MRTLFSTVILALFAFSLTGCESSSTPPTSTKADLGISDGAPSQAGGGGGKGRFTAKKKESKGAEPAKAD